MSSKRKIIITGGSRGIGRALVKRFSENGDSVAFIYAKNDIAAEEVSAQYGAFAVKADLSKPDECIAAYKKCEAYLGSCDVLINNAGTAFIGLITDMTNADIEKMLAIDLQAPIILCREASITMVRNHSGRIVNIGSVWGRIGASCEVVYSAAKAGIRGLTQALAKELGPSGITVNCVEPGVIATDMNKMLDENTLNELKEQTPMERIGTPDDVANAVFFLASDEASFITGTILPVDGGFPS